MQIGGDLSPKLGGSCLLLFCLSNMLTILIFLRVFRAYFTLNATLIFSFIIIGLIIIIIKVALDFDSRFVALL